MIGDDAQTPEWKITERSVEVAQSRAHTWMTFAVRALARTRVAGPVWGGLVTEAWSCVLALSHVRKCALLAVATASIPAARDEAQAALAAFDLAVPRLQDARDFLEHDEDAYVLGKGHLQQPTVKVGKREIDQAAAKEWSYEPYYVDGDSDRPAVRIGAVIDIDLTHACEQARLLQRALLRASHLQGLHPSGQPLEAGLSFRFPSIRSPRSWPSIGEAEGKTV